MHRTRGKRLSAPVAGKRKKRSTFFFFLHPRTAMKTYGAPWQSPIKDHPFPTLLSDDRVGRGIASKLYAFILKVSYLPLKLYLVWRKDIPDLDSDLDWETFGRQLSNHPETQSTNKSTLTLSTEHT